MWKTRYTFLVFLNTYRYVSSDYLNSFRKLLPIPGTNNNSHRVFTSYTTTRIHNSYILYYNVKLCLVIIIINYYMNVETYKNISRLLAVTQHRN